MNQRAAQLVRLLDQRHGHNITEDTAREDISHQVDLIAEWMRIGRQAAKYYVTEEYISGFADHIAAVIDRHNQAIGVRQTHMLKFSVVSTDLARPRGPRKSGRRPGPKRSGGRVLACNGTGPPATIAGPEGKSVCSFGPPQSDT